MGAPVHMETESNISSYVRKKRKKKKSETCCSSDLDHKGWRRSRVLRLTSRGLVSLRNVFRSPPAISSSRMNLGMACRLTPTQRTMFWWLNLLQRWEQGRGTCFSKGFFVCAVLRDRFVFGRCFGSIKDKLLSQSSLRWLAREPEEMSRPCCLLLASSGACNWCGWWFFF